MDTFGPLVVVVVDKLGSHRADFRTGHSSSVAAQPHSVHGRTYFDSVHLAPCTVPFDLPQAVDNYPAPADAYRDGMGRPVDLPDRPVGRRMVALLSRLKHRIILLEKLFRNLE